MQGFRKKENFEKNETTHKFQNVSSTALKYCHYNTFSGPFLLSMFLKQIHFWKYSMWNADPHHHKSSIITQSSIFEWEFTYISTLWAWYCASHVIFVSFYRTFSVVLDRKSVYFLERYWIIGAGHTDRTHYGYTKCIPNVTHTAFFSFVLKQPTATLSATTAKILLVAKKKHSRI